MLGVVLRHLDTRTRLQAHQVCKSWKRLLTHDCTSRTWHDMSVFEAHDQQMTASCSRAWRQKMVWIANRADGIDRLQLFSDNWQVPGSTSRSEARCVFEVFLPYLFGRLKFSSKDLKLAVFTGTEQQACISCMCLLSAGYVVCRCTSTKHQTFAAA